jgi:hypothetical protein
MAQPKKKKTKPTVDKQPKLHEIDFEGKFDDAVARRERAYREANKRWPLFYVREEPMIYKVTIHADAIHEEVTTSAESEEQAKEQAVYSALQRQMQAATVTVEEVAA